MGTMMLVYMIAPMILFLVNIIYGVDYRMKLATQLVVNKKRHSA
ncbi:hypothetical protein [Limosilactobacillus reuteri]|nr:hypothetical protein [Limosilactobacillus reuteri]